MVLNTIAILHPFWYSRMYVKLWCQLSSKTCTFHFQICSSMFVNCYQHNVFLSILEFKILQCYDFVRTLGGILDEKSHCYTLEVSFYSYTTTSGASTVTQPYNEEACVLLKQILTPFECKLLFHFFV